MLLPHELILLGMSTEVYVRTHPSTVALHSLPLAFLLAALHTALKLDIATIVDRLLYIALRDHLLVRVHLLHFILEFVDYLLVDLLLILD